MRCPSCGAEASGKFCSSCGEALSLESCPSCGVSVLPGSRFCTGCGTALAEGETPKKAPGSSVPGTGVPGTGASATGPGGQNLVWWVVGGLMVIVLFSLGYPALTSGPSAPGPAGAPPGMGGGAGTAGAVDLTTMSLEEQGRILFNRVMTSSSAGDTADVTFFLPKALVIYDQLDPPDPDGLYHFALLHQVGGDFEAALVTAERGLADVPDYLLLLAVVGESSAASGDLEGAREAYQHFLDAYETEMGLMRPGYEHHQAIFPVYRDAAEAFLNQG